MLKNAKQIHKSRIIKRSFNQFKKNTYLKMNLMSQYNISSAVYNANLINKSLKILIFYMKEKIKENKKYQIANSKNS